MLSSHLGDPCSISRMPQSLWSWSGPHLKDVTVTSDLFVSCPGSECEQRAQYFGVVCLSQTEGQPGHSVLVLALLLKLFKEIHLILSPEFKEATSIWEVPSATERWWVRRLLKGRFWLFLIIPEGWLSSLTIFQVPSHLLCRLCFTPMKTHGLVLIIKINAI